MLRKIKFKEAALKRRNQYSIYTMIHVSICRISKDNKRFNRNTRSPSSKFLKSSAKGETALSIWLKKRIPDSFMPSKLLKNKKLLIKITSN